MGLESGALKQKKGEISTLIDEVIDEQQVC